MNSMRKAINARNPNREKPLEPAAGVKQEPKEEEVKTEVGMPPWQRDLINRKKSVKGSYTFYAH